MTFTVTPVGVVRSTRNAVADDAWDRERASIDLDPDRFGPEALLGLDGFSHVEVLFLMDRVSPERIEHGARHPRNEPRWPRVGIFAQRGKNRPNRLGLTVCRIIAASQTRLDVAGLDAVDGTPVLDLKPWYAAYGPRGPVREPPWVPEEMARHG